MDAMPKEKCLKVKMTSGYLFFIATPTTIYLTKIIKIMNTIFSLSQWKTMIVIFTIFTSMIPLLFSLWCFIFLFCTINMNKKKKCFDNP